MNGNIEYQNPNKIFIEKVRYILNHNTILNLVIPRTDTNLMQTVILKAI